MDNMHSISSLITAQKNIIDNGYDEVFAPKDSLERMMHTAIREGRAMDATMIEAFTTEARAEILAFRKIGQIGRDWRESRLRAWASKFLPLKASPTVTPSTLGEFAKKQLTPETPFLCIEGVSSLQEADRESRVLIGPYFAILASNVSEAIDLPPDKTLVYTFSRAATGNPAINLRIWKFEAFKEALKGETFETSQINLSQNFDSDVKKITGSVQDLFLAATDHMGRAALSKNPPAEVANKWMVLLKQYGGVPVQTYYCDIHL